MKDEGWTQGKATQKHVKELLIARSKGFNDIQTF
jgi:hypothetical protein